MDLVPLLLLPLALLVVGDDFEDKPGSPPLKSDEVRQLIILYCRNTGRDRIDGHDGQHAEGDPSSLADKGPEVATRVDADFGKAVVVTLPEDAAEEVDAHWVMIGSIS